MDPTERFAELVNRHPVPLDETAVLIGAHADPACDVRSVLRSLDELAAAVPEPQPAALTRTLFGAGGFHGASGDDYYDPANSYIHDVLRRRRGIPITLSVLAIEVGRRIGVALAGVNTPSHFLVRTTDGDELFIDAFDGGRLLSRQDVVELFDRLAPGIDVTGQLQAAGTLPILRRMLANLANVHRRRGDRHQLLWVTRLLTLLPDADAVDRRRYGGALAVNGDFVTAAKVLEAVADADADARPTAAAEDRTRAARLRARLN